jgi:SMC interacting uncharacterized protein involved in chromosome segregation
VSIEELVSRHNNYHQTLETQERRLEEKRNEKSKEEDALVVLRQKERRLNQDLGTYKAEAKVTSNGIGCFCGKCR